MFIRQQQPLGLAHAIWCARHAVGNEPFAVILADDLILADKSCLGQMVDSYQKNGKRCNMFGAKNLLGEKTGRDGILEIDEKDNNNHLTHTKCLIKDLELPETPPALSVVGRYILQPEIFDYLEDMNIGAGEEIRITDVMAGMIETVDVYGYQFEGTRFDCRDRVSFVEANIAFALANPEMKERLHRALEKYI